MTIIVRRLMALRNALKRIGESVLGLLKKNVIESKESAEEEKKPAKKKRKNNKKNIKYD